MWFLTLLRQESTGESAVGVRETLPASAYSFGVGIVFLVFAIALLTRGRPRHTARGRIMTPASVVRGPSHAKPRAIGQEQAVPGAAIACGFSPRTLFGCRVLLVEDGRDELRPIHRMLSRAGASVETARSVVAGIDDAMNSITSDAPFDVALISICMPDQHGKPAVRILRCLGYDFRLIGLTATDTVQNYAPCEELGFARVINMPVRDQELVEVIACCRPWH